MAAESDGVQSEIEVLQSIYLDELQVDRKRDGAWEVSLVLYPSTGEDSVSQFVRLTLTLTLDQQYPASSPAISIHNPRGLSDDKLKSVQKCLQTEAQSCLGSPVLYQLIEKAKEILTESNIPHGNCVICLYGFKAGETFTKTSCYHYFHSHCLGRYVCHSERELQQREKELQEDKTRDGAEHQELTVVCPVCREPLTYHIDQLLSSPAPQLPELDEAAIGSDFQQKWCELQKVLEKQRAKGGIIDPEVESNRFLIHINETPPVVENGNPEADFSPGPLTSASLLETCARADQFATGTSHCRGVEGQMRQNQIRGPRRGGGKSRPQHGRAVAIPEQLQKLSLSSDYMEESNKGQSNHDRQIHRNPESFWSRTGREDSAVQQDVQVSPDHQAIRQPVLGTDLPKGVRSHRGRKRAPHQPAAHAGASGPAWHHCDGQASRSRGGGPRQGHGRSFQRKVVERGREEVL
ncbi:E3 ubiquitin-protein ligase RNF25 [Xenentodon cancila]